MSRLTKLTKLVVDEASLVKVGANKEAEILITKAADEDEFQGTTDKEEFWEQVIVPAIDEFSNAYGERQHERSQAGAPYKHLSREQLVSVYLRTPQGAAQYDTFTQLSDATMQVQKSEEPAERETLESYAWDKMDAIAARQYPDLTPEAGVAKASRESKEWGEIYAISVYSAPLNQVPFDGRSISKSKSDAIHVWKREIDSLAHKAGV